MAEAGDKVLGDPLWQDWDTQPRVPDMPALHLEGFDGPLDLLLDLAERDRIDLSRIAVGDMVKQFIAALARYQAHVPLEQRADWLTLVARLLLLRSRLLMQQTPEAAAALDEAERERSRLRSLQRVRAASAWLDKRPQLGRDVFARLRRARDPRLASYMGLMEACLAVLEREAHAQPAMAPAYTPVTRALFRVPQALARMRARLAGLQGPTKLTAFLPKVSGEGEDRDLVVRSVVASTLVASLELARTAELVLGDGEAFEEIDSWASGEQAARVTAA